MPDRFPGEQEALDNVVTIAKKWGYGNLISVLQHSWSQELQAQGLGINASDMAAGIICVYCKTSRRTGRKAKEGEHE